MIGICLSGANFPRRPRELQNRPTLAPEARQKVAHGETVGVIPKQIKPRMGRKKFSTVIFCRPPPGLEIFLND